MLNKEQIFSLARSLLKVGAGIFIAKGIGDAAVWDIIIAGVLAAGGLGWSAITHRKV